MREHGPLRDARRAAGVLQRGKAVRPDAVEVGGRVGPAGEPLAPAFEGLPEGRVRDGDLGDRAVPEALHPADDPRDERREERADAHGHDVLDGRVREDVREPVGEHVDDDERARAGVRELVPHLGGGVERVRVDEHAPRLEHTERGDGVREAVRHLQRDAVAGGEAELLAEVGRERVRECVDVAVAERTVHAVGHDLREGDPAAVTVSRGAEQLGKVALALGGDLVRDPLGVVGEPGTLCHAGGL